MMESADRKAKQGNGAMPEAKQAVDTTAGEAYEKHMVPGMFVRWTERAVNLAGLQPGEKVLDVACGTGIGARVAAKKIGRKGKIVGLDLDPGVVEVARRLAEAGGTLIEWHCASALEMPLPDAEFDVVFCLQGIQFFPDRVAGFAEIRRVLKRTGRLVATLWGPIESNKGHQAIVRALEDQKVDAAPAKKACSFADPAEIRDAAARAGFGSIEIRTEDGLTEYSSFESFVEGITVGSPSTRRAIQLLSDAGRDRFWVEVRAALTPYLVKGRLAYPMRTHIVVARP